MLVQLGLSVQLAQDGLALSDQSELLVQLEQWGLLAGSVLLVLGIVKTVGIVGTVDRVVTFGTVGVVGVVGTVGTVCLVRNCCFVGTVVVRWFGGHRWNSGDCRHGWDSRNGRTDGTVGTVGCDGLYEQV
jgi:hypothetical protein